MKPEEEKEIIRLAGLKDGIFDLKNVQSFYPGTKVKNGVDTGEPCMIIGVTKKEDINKLDPKDWIPSNLANGIKTDIVEEDEIFS